MRLLRSCARHLLLLNIVLCGAAWFLYGGLELRGYGGEYYSRTSDLWLANGWPNVPGVENVLLPALAAAFARMLNAMGLHFTKSTFILIAALPYALFIYGVTVRMTRVRTGGLLAVAAAFALYTSGMIPYMVGWGGSVDGLGYLIMLPVLVWPESFAVFMVAAALECLNHYLGLIALVLFAFVWHSVRALDHQDWRSGVSYWLKTFMPRAVVSGALLAAFMWFWAAQYPDVAWERQSILMRKWETPELLLTEVLGPSPWTLLSTLKLAIVPIVALMIAPHPRRVMRALVLATPFMAAGALTLVFVDVTRTATMLVISAWLVTMLVAGGETTMAPEWRRRVRRLALVTALLNLLIPNYYVNDGAVRVPASETIKSLIADANYRLK